MSIHPRRIHPLGFAGVVLLLIVGIVAAIVGSSSSGSSKGTAPGGFNPAGHPKAPVLSVNDIGPGACWPSRTFNNAKGKAQAVSYLSGKANNAPGVVKRDQSWLTQNAWYYNYKGSKQGDANWVKAQTLEQLPWDITVLDTYCPKGGNTVMTWKVVTLPAGKWLLFAPGHAPSDVIAKRTTTLIPERDTTCGNFLLPAPAEVPSSTAPKPPTSTAPKPQPTPPVVHPTPTPSPTCVVPPNGENNCSGKRAAAMPSYAKQHPVVQPSPGMVIGRDGNANKQIPYPKPTPSPSSSSDSGVGGTGTKGVAPTPSQPPATQPATQPAPSAVATPTM